MDEVDDLLFKEIEVLRKVGKYMAQALNDPGDSYLRAFALALWEQTFRGGCK
jgi:hypothetical protein